MSVERRWDASDINVVLNDPSVRPWVGGAGSLDLGPGLADERNVLLMEGHLGGLFFHWQAPGIYEVHTQFLPEGRGRLALHAAREAVDWMFARTDMVELWTKCAEGNRGANWLTKTLGGRLWFTRPTGWVHGDGTMEALHHYALGYGAWAEASKGCREVGYAFHEELEAKLPSFRPHLDDPTHYAQVGASVLAVRGGQMAKGLDYYNRWAGFAGYPQVMTIATAPPVLDIGDGVKIMLTADSFEVL